MVIREMRVRVNQHCPMKQSRTKGMTMNWWKALAGWWERQRPFRKKAYGYRGDEFYVDTPIFTERVDLWHAPKRYERQVMPNGPISHNNRAVTGDHGAVETSDGVSYNFIKTTETMPDGSLPEGADSIDWYRIETPPNPIAERRARAEELLRKLNA